jgi:ATP adenylyltransferase
LSACILTFFIALNVPFTYFHQDIPPNATPASLYKSYTDLYAQCDSAVKTYIKAHSNALTLHDTTDGSSPFSYNMGMTTTSMVLCPRRKEGELLYTENGSEVGFVAFNGTLLAGTLMVKGEKEWKYLREKQGALDTVLTAIGISKGDTNNGSYSGTKM